MKQGASTAHRRVGLLQEVRERIRLKHYSYRTEQANV
jgi:hypothetical protein